MDLKDLKALIKMVDESNVSEVEIEQEQSKTRGKLKIRISKSNGMVPVTYMGQPQQHFAPPQVQQLPSSSPVHFESKETAEKSSAERPLDVVDKGNYLEIKSPIVGTFYRSPAPDADSYVEVGSVVKPGQTLCIIEAMKIMNEIESEVGGKIAKILVENGQPVEYNQTLFLVDKA
ncbi:MAG: acetyl-CoA carboxylase biotin carboxyl carrier protein [Bacteroidetes bacterium]|nr:acetyl-CoA carboxylase biotin carboxyl carrier protein [Bacteroidota bacterium]